MARRIRNWCLAVEIINTPVPGMFGLLMLIVWTCLFSVPSKAEAIAGLGADAYSGERLETIEEVTEVPKEPAPFSVDIVFDKEKVHLTAKDTGLWRELGTDQVYYWDYDRLYAYFYQLRRDYETPPGEVRFTTHDGRHLLFTGQKNCGWQMNVEMTVDEFVRAVDAGEKEMRPIWNSGCVYTSENDVGTKYVEIDIPRQKVYLYEEGRLVYDCDCVTGTKGYTETTPGVFQVIYKASPSTLQDKDPNGYEYSQEVNYWICFNGSQGMHDALWRGEFGGDIYTYWGSHGCVNISLDAAERFYNEVYTYYPFVVYDETIQEVEVEEETEEKLNESLTEGATDTGLGAGLLLD